MIYPLTSKDEQRVQATRKIVKKKMKKIKDLLSCGRYNTIETTTKTGKENKMETYEINDTNMMTEAEAKELFDWLEGKILRGE